MKITVVLIFPLFLVWACESPKEEKKYGPETLIRLDLVDSLMVNETNILTMDDYSSESEYFLLRGTQTRNLYLADKKGLILKEFKLEKSLGGVGYRFLDKNRWVGQSWDKNFHVYTLAGQKIMEFPSIHEGFANNRVYTFRTTFTPYISNGTTKIIGEEPDSFDPGKINTNILGSDFYSRVKTVYDYNLNSKKNRWLLTYPDSWLPFQTQQFVGTSFPLIAFDKKTKELAILPVIGNQLFVYDYSDSIPVLKHEVSLIHRFRPNNPPVLEKEEHLDYSDYPYFTDLRKSGNYILVGFHTRIPEGIMAQLKEKSADFQHLSAYQTAQNQFNKPYYLLIKNGKQIGILEDFPVHGSFNFMDEEGILYINDNVAPKVDRSYNIFYKLKIIE